MMPDSERGVVHSDSRWWYWVAAVPAVVALWTASAVWVVLGVSLDPGTGTGGVGGSGIGGEGLLLLPAIALGVPAIVVFLLLPIALWRDGEAARRAGSGWPDIPLLWAAAAGVIDIVLVVGLVVLARIAPTLGFGIILVAVVAGTALALSYLRGRSRHVWTPTNLWELRRELRPN